MFMNTRFVKIEMALAATPVCENSLSRNKELCMKMTWKFRGEWPERHIQHTGLIHLRHTYFLWSLKTIIFCFISCNVMMIRLLWCLIISYKKQHYIIINFFDWNNAQCGRRRQRKVRAQHLLYGSKIQRTLERDFFHLKFQLTTTKMRIVIVVVVLYTTKE